MTDGIDEVIDYCRQGGRVCPMPMRWNALYKMLTSVHQQNSRPNAPLILAAWNYASNLEKQIRLEEHVRWAAQHDLLDKVASFLRGLPESEWHHIDE